VRAVRRTTLPAAPACQVLSVDEWGLRRGRTAGAILVDGDRHPVRDLLPDRVADTFAAWLQTQPPIPVMSRDRGATCAEGATRGAPQAVPVADRFAILQQLVEALQPVLGHDHAARRAAAHAVAATAPLPPRSRTAPRARARAAAHARRPARYDAVQRLHAASKSTRQLSAEVRIGPTTVRRDLRCPTCPATAPAPARRARLTPLAPERCERWNAGEQTGEHWLREIRARGEQGSGAHLSARLALWRVGPRHGGPYARQEIPAPAPPPPIPAAPRTVGWLLLQEDAARSALEPAYGALVAASQPAASPAD
jgi:hypothetical protein